MSSISRTHTIIQSHNMCAAYVHLGRPWGMLDMSHDLAPSVDWVPRTVVCEFILATLLLQLPTPDIYLEYAR